MNCVPFRRRKPTDKHDFTINRQGALILLRPNTARGIAWANETIGKDNGFQPYWPTVLLEERYVDQILAGIHKLGLVAR
jgi:hypothetical protein